MPRINLLPWRETERKRKRQEFGFAAGGAVVLALLLGFVVKWQFESAIDRQNERNELLKKEIAQLDQQITKILGLEQQKQRLVERMQVIEQLQRSRPEVVHLVDQLARTLPDGVYLTAVKQNNRRVQITGNAQSSTRVSSLLVNLDASPFLEDSKLEVVDNKGGAMGSQFSLTTVQTSQQAVQEDAKAAKGKPKPARAGARR